MAEPEKIRLGISACLLGEKVRYDGQHQHDRLITDTLGRYIDFVPVCPEAECGLGVPRETMRLTGNPENPKLMTTRTNIDHTERMKKWAQKRVKELEKEDLCGFIFKSKSPSSGMERVKVYVAPKKISKTGIGLYAKAFMDHFPLLPVEEDGRLHDPQLRENFIERIFVYKRWRELLKSRKTVGGLVDFHTTHKLLIMAHSNLHYRMMGTLVAHAKETAPEELFSRYEKSLMEALRLTATSKKNANVLQHMVGYFKKQLSAEEKQEILELIDQYRLQYIPLIVPITLINHFVRKYDAKYLAKQYYLNPHPVELKLRNHA